MCEWIHAMPWIQIQICNSQTHHNQRKKRSKATTCQRLTTATTSQPHMLYFTPNQFQWQRNHRDQQQQQQYVALLELWNSIHNMKCYQKSKQSLSCLIFVVVVAVQEPMNNIASEMKREKNNNDENLNWNFYHMHPCIQNDDGDDNELKTGGLNKTWKSTCRMPTIHDVGEHTAHADS